MTFLAQAALILFFAAIAVGILLEHLVLPLLERVLEGRAESEVSAASPSYALTLLIRFDEESGSFCPSVQLRGYGELTQAWIRLKLVDRDEAAIGTELALPAFEPPDWTTPNQVSSAGIGTS